MLQFHTGVPAMVPSVTIDLTSVNIDRNNNVNFRLNWDEPFANFDPVINYTITISCTNNIVCPMMFSTNNVTRTLDVNLITDLSMINHTISMTASNNVGPSNATTRIIVGELHYNTKNVLYVV